MTDAPRRRVRLIHLALAAILLLAALVAWPVTWALTVEPVVAVDYALEIERTVAAAQPEGENGWPLIRQATETWTAITTDLESESDHAAGRWFRGVDLDLLLHYPEDQERYDEPGEEDIARAEQALAELESRGVFALVDRAAACPRFVRPTNRVENAPMYEILLPELGPMRMIAKACCIHVERAVAANDAAQAELFLRRGLVLARAAVRQGILIDHLVGYAIDALMLDRTRGAVLRADADAATLAGLRRAIEETFERGTPGIAMTGERAMFLDVAQRLYSDDGAGDGVFLPGVAGGDAALGYFGGGGETESPPAIANLLGLFMPRRRTVVAEAESIYAEYARRMDLSHAERLALAETPDGALVPSPSNTLLTLLMPALDRFIDQADITTTRARATILLLAIEEHRARDGASPATLADLVPVLLDAIPEDPFDPAGFHYRVDPAAPRGYLLWSSGADGTDDGGTPPSSPGRGGEAWSSAGEGTDVLWTDPL